VFDDVRDRRLFVNDVSRGGERAMRRIQLTAWMAVALLALSAGSVLAQGPTHGTITGRVTSEGEALPGVLVVATSPALMGERTAFTTVNGDYLLPNLPPGDYIVSYQLEGFQAASREVRVSTAQETRINVAMHLEAVEEVILVTGEAEAISRTTTSAATVTTATLERLPVGRGMLDGVNLAAGVHRTGPGGQVSISGSHSFENLFMVNGVVVNENIRGQPFPMFIEDAILETTTMTSGVSAEYGRFSGGVVNTLTKSGGNQFEGSFRTSFTNSDWRARTPFERERNIEFEDDIIPRYEATLGGPFLRDRLWFFGAGMYEDFEDDRTLPVTGIPYKFLEEETRWEAKLTLAATPQHSFVGSMMNRTRDQPTNVFGVALDLRSIDNRALPEEFWVLNYSGILTHNFFIEANAARREFTFEGSGAKTRDMVEGTLMVDRATGQRWWSPTFCGVCPDEERNMDNYLAKATYFLSTDRLGTHNVILGWDSYNDIRATDNHQSGSDFRIHTISRIIAADGEVFPVIGNPAPGTVGTGTWITWWPIFEPTRGTRLWTHSAFVNDRWQVSDRLALNVGLRYDRNDGQNAMRDQVTKDDMFSPRLGATYDLRGDGSWIVNASVGRYVAAVANNIADSTSVAGTPAQFRWDYLGPEINTDPTQPLIGTREAIQIVWSWFCGANLAGCQQDPRINNVGGPGGTPLEAWFFNIPGATSAIRDGRLKSPSADELMIGASARLGARGIVRADIVHRDFKDFYATFRNMETIGLGVGDFALIGNTNDRERVYTGLHTQTQYRFTDRLSGGLAWTWSHARGDFNGETGPNATITGGIHSYPEYFDRSWSEPRRNLAIDERHRARLWLLYDLVSSDRFGNLNLGLIQSFNSGQTYSAVGGVNTRPFVTNPGYATPPAAVNYYFHTDEFKTDDITSTDIALSYSFFLNVGNRRGELFVQPRVTNVFNESGVHTVNTLVRTATNTLADSCPGSPTGRCLPFNPFAETPVRGLHYEFGPDFGQPTAATHYQTPRTFRLSVGLRM
jgi:hypothetical protein